MSNSPKGHPELPSIVGVLLEEGGRWYRLKGDAIPARFFSLLLEDGRTIDRLLISDMHRVNAFPLERHRVETSRVLASNLCDWPPVPGEPEPWPGTCIDDRVIMEWPLDSPGDEGLDSEHVRLLRLERALLRARKR